MLLKLKTTQALGMIAALIQASTLRVCVAHLKLISFNDVATIGSILHSARYWPQVLPKLETFSHIPQVIRIIRKLRFGRNMLGGWLHFNRVLSRIYHYFGGASLGGVWGHALNFFFK